MPIANGQVMALALQSRNVILATWYANLTGGQASNYWTLPASQLYARIAAHYGPKTEGDYCSLPISYAYHDIYIAVGGVETRDYTWGEAFALANIYAALRGHQGSKGKVAGYRELGKQILLALITQQYTPVAAPSNLVATGVSATQIDLSWTDNSGGDAGFIVEVSTDNMNFSQDGQVAEGVTTYQSTGLDPSSQYFYRVRSKKNAFISIPSNIATWTFDGGNLSFSTVLDAAEFMLRGDISESPSLGGSLIVDNKSLGNYEFTRKFGNQTISSFNATDWFAGSGDQDGRSSWIIVNGDLEIESGETLIPPGRRLFTVVYVKGDLIVDGAISMTARGANHSSTGSNITAQDILLAEGVYSGVTNPKVPAIGGAGGLNNGNAVIAAGAGTLGGLGGGGAGTRSTANPVSDGRAGSCFSGGPGAGANASGAAGEFGGVGGTGSGGGPSASGAGNPGGPAFGTAPAAPDGTGGCLFIFAAGVYQGSGSVSANGSNGGGGGNIFRGGGASGGGHVTIFCNSSSGPTPTSNGGAGGVGSGYNGGAGGNGTARILLTQELLPETHAYAAASGATDLVPLNNLFGYIIGEGLWSNFRIYPQKSAQNSGSGSTVYGAGGLTSNNGTLIGSPTWGSGGISYNGSNQCARISDFLSDATLTVWTRLAQGNTGLTGGQVYFSQFDTGGNNRSVVFQQRNAAGGNLTLLQRNSTGGTPAADFENYDTASNVSSTADRSYVVQWVDGGGRGLWINNTAESISRTGGTDQTARLNTSVDILLAAQLASGSPSTFLQATYIAAAFLEGPTPTTTQRETITDLINAL